MALPVWVLVLEDSEERISKFEEQFCDCMLTIAKHAADAIELLSRNQYDLVSLDHDLGGQVFVDSRREDCGMEVVRWIVENKPDIDSIIVHSWNIPAAQLMRLKLYQAGYNVKQIPFGFQE